MFYSSVSESSTCAAVAMLVLLAVQTETAYEHSSVTTAAMLYMSHLHCRAIIALLTLIRLSNTLLRTHTYTTALHTVCDRRHGVWQLRHLV
jgi:hypothetical protein